jgi:hypothetical protein
MTVVKNESKRPKRVLTLEQKQKNAARNRKSRQETKVKKRITAARERKTFKQKSRRAIARAQKTHFSDDIALAASSLLLLVAADSVVLNLEPNNGLKKSCDGHDGKENSNVLQQQSNNEANKSVVAHHADEDNLTDQEDPVFLERVETIDVEADVLRDEEASDLSPLVFDVDKNNDTDQDPVFLDHVEIIANTDIEIIDVDEETPQHPRSDTRIAQFADVPLSSWSVRSVSELTNQQESILLHAFSQEGEDNDVVNTTVGAPVLRKSLLSLMPAVWLEDEIINHLYYALAKRDKALCLDRTSRKRSHFFNSFFMTSLLNEGHVNPDLDGVYCYRRVSKYTQKVEGRDIFDLDKVFFPINFKQVHWICAVASMQEHIIRIYDSGGGGSWSQYSEAILKFIGDEHKAVKGSELPELSKWLLLDNFDTSTPRQQNSKRVVVWFLMMYSWLVGLTFFFFSYYCKALTVVSSLACLLTTCLLIAS